MSILQLCCTYISLYLPDWSETVDESPIFVLTHNDFIGGEMMPYDIGKSEKTLVNMQNSQQNRPWLKSLYSGCITTQKICVYLTGPYKSVGSKGLINPLNK